jgi:hypothetical protein
MNPERRIIISPVVYLLEFKQQQWKGEAPRRDQPDEGIVNGWILNSLPRELQEMAEKKHYHLVRLDIAAWLKKAKSETCSCFPGNCDSHQIIISPLVYLMEEMRDLLSWSVFTKPRTIVSGWILGLLPQELHQEAARRVKDPLVEKFSTHFEMSQLN